MPFVGTVTGWPLIVASVSVTPLTVLVVTLEETLLALVPEGGVVAAELDSAVVLGSALGDASNSIAVELWLFTEELALLLSGAGVSSAAVKEVASPTDTKTPAAAKPARFGEANTFAVTWCAARLTLPCVLSSDWLREKDTMLPPRFLLTVNISKFCS